jgi:hypothetical protein
MPELLVLLRHRSDQRLGLFQRPVRPNTMLLTRSDQMGSRLRRSGDIFVAQQKRETLVCVGLN